MCLGREAYACLLGESKRKKKDTPEDARESLKAPFEIKRKKKKYEESHEATIIKPSRGRVWAQMEFDCTKKRSSFEMRHGLKCLGLLQIWKCSMAAGRSCSVNTNVIAASIVAHYVFLP